METQAPTHRRATGHGPRLALVVTLLFTVLSVSARAQGTGTQDRPNQYPSPTVKVPVGKEVFNQYEFDKNKVTGAWGGFRSKLADHGVALQIQYAAVIMQNTHGGFDSGMVGGGLR